MNKVSIVVLRPKTAQLTARLSGIQALQQANHPTRLSAPEATSHGFVTLRHSLEWLHELTSLAPQVVALDANESVVGYTLSVSPSGLRRKESHNHNNNNKNDNKNRKELLELYEPFFSMIERLEWDGAPLDEAQWVMGGQCCVANQWRRQGLMGRLYQAQAEALSTNKAISALATAIDRVNVPSQRAHEAAGFVEIGRCDYTERPSEHGTNNQHKGGWSLVLRPI